VQWTSRTDEAKQEFDSLKRRHSKKVTCDGPCGRKVHPDEVTQFGDCDHVVCHECLSPVKNLGCYDGSSSCCNTQCLTRSGISPSPVTVPASSNCTVLEIRVLLFSKENHVRRQQSSFEQSSDWTVRQLMKTMASRIESLKECSLHFTNKPHFQRSDLVPLPASSMRHVKLAELSRGSDYLTLVVNRPGLYLFT
jgi:hypothetical protein